MNYQVVIEQNAHQDITEIHYYIATNLQAPTAAAKQVTRIYDAIGELTKLPLINPKYENDLLAKRGLRKLVVDNYLVFYTVNEQQKQVVVIMVAYSGRNVDALLKNAISKKVEKARAVREETERILAEIKSGKRKPYDTPDEMWKDLGY